VGDQRRDRVRLDRGIGRDAGLRERAVDDPPVLHVGRQQAQAQRRRAPPRDRHLVRDRPVGADQQQVVLAPERERLDLGQRLVVEVREPGVDLPARQALGDLARAHRHDLDAHARVALAKRRRDERRDGQRGRDRADPQRPLHPAAQAADLLFETVEVAQRSVHPRQHALALGGEALEAPRAPYERDAELAFQRANGGRQRRLRDVAGLGRAAEVPLARQRRQVLELPEEHTVDYPRWPTL
jgi:hypothetical protein